AVSAVAAVDTQGASAELVVLVPGLRNFQRAQQLRSSLDWLRHQNLSFHCVVYSYKDYIQLPVTSEFLEPCSLQIHRGAWMDHLKLRVPEIDRAKYVLHWIDSIVPGPNLDLKTMMRVMEEQSFQLLSPSFRSEPSLLEVTATGEVSSLLETKDQVFMTQMANRHSGRVLEWLEFQFSLFSREAFLCKQQFIRNHSDIIHLGWGVDMVTPRACSMKVGIFDSMTMRKNRLDSESSYDYKAARAEMHYLLARSTSKYGYIHEYPNLLGYFDVEPPLIRRQEDASIPMHQTLLLVLLAMLVAGLFLSLGDLSDLGVCLTFCALQLFHVFLLKYLLSGALNAPAPFALAVPQLLAAAAVGAVRARSAPFAATSHGALAAAAAGGANLSLAFLDLPLVLALRSSGIFLATALLRRNPGRLHLALLSLTLLLTLGLLSSAPWSLGTALGVLGAFAAAPPQDLAGLGDGPAASRASVGALALALPALIYPHPTASGLQTDWQVLQQVGLGRAAAAGAIAAVSAGSCEAARGFYRQISVKQQAAVFSLLGGASLAAVYLLEDSPPLGAAAGGCCVALALAVAWEEELGSPKSA
ncbi:unnamed protein product, partial [Effrenium voratum]